MVPLGMLIHHGATWDAHPPWCHMDEHPMVPFGGEYTEYKWGCMQYTTNIYTKVHAAQQSVFTTVLHKFVRFCHWEQVEAERIWLFWSSCSNLRSIFIFLKPGCIGYSRYLAQKAEYIWTVPLGQTLIVADLWLIKYHRTKTKCFSASCQSIPIGLP